MKRYDCETEYDENADGEQTGYGHMEPSATGAYVAFADAQVLIAALRTIAAYDEAPPHDEPAAAAVARVALAAIGEAP